MKKDQGGGTALPATAQQDEEQARNSHLKLWQPFFDELKEDENDEPGDLLGALVGRSGMFEEQWDKQVQPKTDKRLKALQDRYNFEGVDLDTRIANYTEAAPVPKDNAGKILESMLRDLYANNVEAPISTGYKSLDDGLLDGGLYTGLYIIGSISSLGKTTFCLQMADAIAKAGRDVLFFSLEMSSRELIAKSISRLTFDFGNQNDATTTRTLLSGTRHWHYTDAQAAALRKAVGEYRTFAPFITFSEGVGNIGIREIEARVQQHYNDRGRYPVVIIDYLQILAPDNVKATDKQNTDKAVLELKRLSRDKHIPVVVISSFNRSSYNEGSNTASFKESGAIEYSADVLIALQYKGMDKADEAKQAYNTAVEAGARGDDQEIQVKILKNRNGGRGDATLYLVSKYNRFFEGGEIKQAGIKWKN